MTDAQNTPTEHSSLVGGSTAARRIGCPRSWSLEQLAPKDKGNEFTREGTALHEMMAKVLAKNLEPDDLLPFTHKQAPKGAEDAWELTIDEELWYELGQPALDALDDFIADTEDAEGADFDMLIEQKCEMVGIDGAYGTSDIVWRCGSVSGVWDWKFGRGKVEVEENKQLMFYARAAMHSCPSMFDATDPQNEIVLTISQPKLSDDPYHWSTTVGELEEYRVELMSAIKEIQTDGDNARIEQGDWCNFATCKTLCPLYLNQTVELAEKFAAVKEADEGVFGYAEDLPHLLKLAAMAEEFATEVFKQGHAFMTDGGKVEGYKLVDKKSSGRVFTVSPEEVQTFMKNRRYKFDDYMPRKMASMPQMEKLLKKDGRFFPEEMYEKKPSSGTTLVPVGDPRAEHVSDVEKASELGDKLAHLRGE